MPYIQENDRPALNTQLFHADLTPGELTYVIYRLAKSFTRKNNGFFGFALVIGCLMCATFEIYRRVVAPYEDKKIIENGDVE